ncbi:unnamed protein product [Rotaria sp. Silwood2]|nr:unnamed protein product [Rotaria sp. Silwood2]CAF2942051.1 unnamed protein product [Rotaria sp. Silwood2]CAF3179821.1 unnamed protein product [Rotaria sp. Silwood2]
MIHLILHIPEDYPLSDLAGNIAPALEFDSRYHGHIHDDHSPGYTLSTALLQIITFCAEPDLHYDPSPENITHLCSMVEKFRCATCGHSYAKPNPAILNYIETMSDKQQIKEETISKEEEEERLKYEREPLLLKVELMEKLMCSVTKQNVIEDNICLGYPLWIKRDGYGRLWPEIILELISYDAYIAEI